MPAAADFDDDGAVDLLYLRSSPVPLRNQARDMLVAAENAAGFAGHYYVALQQDPQVVMAHAAVINLIGRRKAEP